MTKRKHKLPKYLKFYHRISSCLPDNLRKVMPRAMAFILTAGLGVYFMTASHAATLATSQEAESGTLSGNATSVSDASASATHAVKFGTAGTSSGGCTSPVYTTSSSMGSYSAGTNVSVNNNVWGAIGSNWSQQLNVCSASSWYINAKFQDNGGTIQTYPDTRFDVPAKAISSWNSMQTCFGENNPVPSGGEWDYAYDVWLDNYNIEIMVWNRWTTGGVPPSGSRAVTIDGVAYHEFQGGGDNEWIYVRDTQVNSGCFDMLSIMKDLVAHPSTSGIKNTTVPLAIEYGIEVASTSGTGTEKFEITNATLTAN